MKCRNWRTEDPERSGKIRKDPEGPEPPESPERSGISGSLRKRPVRAAPENPEPPKIPSASSPARKYMLFAPKPQALRRFICPASPHLRTKCRTPLHCGPQNTPAPHHNPFPCVSLRNRPKAAPEPPEPPEQARKGRSAPAAPPPVAPARSIFTICNPIYYISRRYTPILIINNKLFALFLARFKIKPYLCIV